jgi:demethylmenaquinone methyltransferase/2-methoxy-6-polyprenyl-1,4-benzoquinol methylase
MTEELRADTDAVASLLASQRTYYDERADDYGDVSRPADRKHRSLMSVEAGRALIDEFQLTGDVLELACGAGIFTAELIRPARSVTALDASARMLEINRRRVADARVTYVNADIFDWAPERRYDAVFFGFWLSHVPPAAFDEFWRRVRACLAPNGRVAFVDEDDRAAGNDDVFSISDVPAARRTLADGRQFDIVKVFWRPEDLHRRVRSCGWDVVVRCTGKTFLYGVGRPSVTHALTPSPPGTALR